MFSVSLIFETCDQLALRYLFEGVLGVSSFVSASIERVEECLDEEDLPPLWILGGDRKPARVLQLVRKVKNRDPSAAVVVLSRGGSDDFAAQAFKAGAADVLKEIGSLEVFTYRLRARLSGNEILTGLDFDDVTWDTEDFVSQRAGLTATESQIMHLMIHQDGQLVTRDQMSRAIDKKPWSYGDRKFDVHVAKLRKKLKSRFGEKIHVSTVRSAGYKLYVS